MKSFNWGSRILTATNKITKQKKCFKCKILVMNFLYFLCRAAMFDLSTARYASGIFSFS